LGWRAAAEIQVNIPDENGWLGLQIEKKSESKVLDRSYVEAVMEGKAGKISRKEAIAAVAQEMGVPAENVALIRLDGESGTKTIVGRFYVYGSPASKKSIQLRFLEERLLSKEEREKLKQERKKAATPAAAAPEAKK
jgi:ribosomal protein S24E